MNRKIQNKITRYGLNLLNKDIDFLKLGNKFTSDSKTQEERIGKAMSKVKLVRLCNKLVDYLTLTLEERLLKRLNKVEINFYNSNSTTWKLGDWNYHKDTYKDYSYYKRWGETVHEHKVTIPKADAVRIVTKMVWGMVDDVEGFYSPAKNGKRKPIEVCYIYNRKKGLVKTFLLTAEVDGWILYSHSENLDDAKKDLRKKIEFRLKEKKEKTLSSKEFFFLTPQVFRRVTGACETGTRTWMANNNIQASSLPTCKVLTMLNNSHWNNALRKAIN